MTHAAHDPVLQDARVVLSDARLLLDVEPPAAAELLLGASALISALPSAEQAEAAALQARSLFAQDEFKGAAEHARRSAELFRSAADVEGLVAALLQEAEIRAADEQYERVSQLAAEVREVLGSAPSRPLVQALNLQAMALFLQGRYREASAVTLEQSSMCSALEDHEEHAKCLNNLGLIHIELGDLPGALGHLLRCYEYIHACPAPLDSLASACLINIGHIQQIMREFSQARESFRQGVEAARRCGHLGNEVAGLTGIGMAVKDQGQFREAVQVLSMALALAQENGRQHDEAEILDALGQVYTELGQQELALETFAQALSIANELGAVASQQNTLFNLARLHVNRSQPARAVTYFESALASAQQSGSEGAELEIREQLGEALHGLGRFEHAAAQFREALTLERTLRDRDGQESLQKLTAQLEVERAQHQAQTYRVMNETAQRARLEAETLVQERTAALEQAQVEIITRLGMAGEYRDDRTGEHTQRVSHLAASLAAAIGLPDAEVNLIRQAARLHDIGKIGVPDAVLLKTGRLTPEEFHIMRQHTTIGARVLEGGQSPLMRLAEQIAVTHHEHWNGAGYPHGLSGEDIPLPGRIVAIVDVWDALTTERSYKVAWTREEAWREMAAQSGAQFDPYLLEVFLGMIAGSLNAEQGDAGAATPGIAAPEVTPQPQERRAAPQHVGNHVRALNSEAWQVRRADPAQSAGLAHEAYLIAEQHGYDLGMGHALCTLAFHDVNASDFQAALDRAERAVTVAQVCGDVTLERNSVNQLANVYRSLYSTEKSMECLLRSIELSRQLGDLAGEAHALTNLGVLASSRLKDQSRALAYYQQAHDVLEHTEDRAAQVACSSSMADLFQQLGQWAQAQTCGEHAAQTSHEIGDTLHEALSVSVVARALDAQGEHALAAGRHAQALGLLEQPGLDMPEPLAWLRVYSGCNLEAAGNVLGAQAIYERVLEDSAPFAGKELALLTHRKLNALHKAQGNMETAMAHLEAEWSLQQALLEQETAMKTRALTVQFEVNRAQTEAELYKLRSVELASANVALELANREKSALVSALQEQALLLERQLREDTLSGVSNRRHVEEVLASEFRRHQQDGRIMSMLMLDVDHFKQVNDHFSHLVGDEVLRRLGALLRECGRPGDTAGRYGGEEFVLVLPDTPLAEAAHQAEQLRAEVERAPWHEVAPGLQITVSMGVAATGHLPNFERLVARADEALYEAKKYRNRCSC